MSLVSSFLCFLCHFTWSGHFNLPGSSIFVKIYGTYIEMTQMGKFFHAIILYKTFYNKIVFILRDFHSSQDTKDWNREGSELMLGKNVICCKPFCGLNFMTSVLGVLACILKDHTAFNFKMVVPSSSSSQVVQDCMTLASDSNREL